MSNDATGISAFMQTARTAQAISSPKTITNGNLQVIRNTDGIVVGVADYTPNSRKAHERGEAFCARKGEKVLRFGNRDYELVASWTGTPIVKATNGIRNLRDGEELDPTKIVGVNLLKGLESAWFVALRAI